MAYYILPAFYLTFLGVHGTLAKIVLIIKDMAEDKFSATWVSHSSMKDFLNCPRAYFLNNVYRDPKTGHKISLMCPPLALGQAVHDVVESLSVLETSKRFQEPLLEKFERSWSKVSGMQGGFRDKETEMRYKNRGEEMIRRVMRNKGVLANLAVKIKMDLPHFWLSEQEGIILCGKIDWLEYLQDIDSVHIIDFKTGMRDEEEGSLQLPIYHLLVHHCQKRSVVRASYWYLERNDGLTEMALPDLEEATQKVLSLARKVKLTRQLKKFDCVKGGQDGCKACIPLEKIVRGEATFVGVNDFSQDMYVLTDGQDAEEDSVIL